MVSVGAVSWAGLTDGERSIQMGEVRNGNADSREDDANGGFKVEHSLPNRRSCCLARSCVLFGAHFMLCISLLFVQEQHQAALMTYEEYGRTRHQVPYVVTLKANGGRLLYLGSRHVYDPSDTQNVEIEKQWRAFRPTVAFSEGSVPPVEKTAKDAIALHGEAGLVRFLAYRDHIPIYSLEPDLRLELRELRSRFTCEQLKLFYALRQVEPLKKSGRESSIDEQISGVLAWLSGFQDLDCSLRTLKELEASYRKLVGGQNWRDVRAEWFSPVYTQPPIYLNEVSRASSRIRDEHMIRLLAEQMKSGGRVFAVVGATHVVVQERALRASLNIK